MTPDMEMKLQLIKDLIFRIRLRTALLLIQAGLKLIQANKLPQDHRFWRELGKLLGEKAFRSKDT